MTLVRPIQPSQTKARAPVDEDLMDSIREDLNELDGRSATVKTFDYAFRWDGPLSCLGRLPAKRIDGNLVTKAATFAVFRAWLEYPGNSGTLTLDVRKYVTNLDARIIEIRRQYLQNINSISQIAPAQATQSISRSTAQISTQSISRWKASLNILSIAVLPGGRARLTLSAAPDAGWVIGKTVTNASATAGANNGSFTILAVNDDGGNNVIIGNPAAVEQTGAAGTCSLDAWAYNFSNPVSSEFAAGEIFTAAAHTTGANNGAFEIAFTNSGGNNIVIFSAAGVAQAAPAGTADVNRWVYAFAATANADFIVGEFAVMASHTSGVNNGSFRITGVNINAGNNVTVYNSAGTAQGTAAGNVNTSRWVYALPTNPTTDFIVGQTMFAKSTTALGNSGIFTVVKLNHLGTNNVVVANVSGVAQVGAGGTLEHTRMIYKFDQDRATFFSALLSRAEIINAISPYNSGDFTVVEVNRGGGSNYNIVVESSLGVEQLVPSGRVASESRSIFNTPPTLTLPTNSRDTYNRHLRFVEVTTGFSASATVAAGDQLGAEVLTRPTGNARNLVMQLG